MKLLAIDAATEACSAALLLDGDILERFEIIGRGHAERLLPMTDELLTESGLTLRALDAIAFGRGPGGFTGLRIAAGIAQGLAAGSGRPVLPVSNLATLAAGAARTTGAARILACLDARMGQVYWAAFDCGAAVPAAMTEERLSDPDAVSPPPGARWLGAGSGFAAYPAIAVRIAEALDDADGGLLPRARDMLGIAAADLAAGRGLEAARGLPVYLRDDVVHRR